MWIDFWLKTLVGSFQGAIEGFEWNHCKLTFVPSFLHAFVWSFIMTNVVRIWYSTCTTTHHLFITVYGWILLSCYKQFQSQSLIRYLYLWKSYVHGIVNVTSLKIYKFWQFFMAHKSCEEMNLMSCGSQRGYRV